MKVTTTINGTEIMIEDADYKEIIDFVDHIKKASDKEETIKDKKEKIDHSVELSGKHFETWDYLGDHECKEGVTASALARALNTTEGAIYARMSYLIERGYAIRLARGRYKAMIP